MLTLGLNAQFAGMKEAFKPHGKGIVRIFSNVHAGMGEVTDDTAFELQRAYLGYRHHFSPAWSAQVIFDVSHNGTNFQAFAKNAFVAYEKDAWSLHFGMTGTQLFKPQERFWGHRYLYKSAMDEYRFMSSADLGLVVGYKVSKVISADISILNGEGHKKIQDALGKFRLGAGISITPIENLALRAYYDYYFADTIAGHNENLSSIALFVGFSWDIFSIGAEYNLQHNSDFAVANDRQLFSTYATCKVNDKLKSFARFDRLNNDANKTKDQTVLIAGVEWRPIQNVKLAPNYRCVDNENAKAANYIYMSVGVEF